MVDVAVALLIPTNAPGHPAAGYLTFAPRNVLWQPPQPFLPVMANCAVMASLSPLVATLESFAASVPSAMAAASKPFQSVQISAFARVFLASTSGRPVPLGNSGGILGAMATSASAAALPAGEAAILAQGRALIGWHESHRFCAKCGEETRPRDAGYLRVCEDCGAEHFPRTDPVVIMLVTRGDRCLLGRQSGWPPGMFSALAGFVEPGEMIEEAVRREVREEASIEVGEVRYLASQPWPFPSSLMIGCLAEGVSEEIRLDDKELDDARWFPLELVRKALAAGGSADGLFVPPPMAIAHQLIRFWAAPSD